MQILTGTSKQPVSMVNGMSDAHNMNRQPDALNTLTPPTKVGQSGLLEVMIGSE